MLRDGMMSMGDVIVGTTAMESLAEEAIKPI
jgi:hypothetical protein